MPEDHVSPDDGIVAVLRQLEAAANDITIVGVTGPVGAGKSTIAERLVTALSAEIIRTDDYLPDYDDIPFEERDEPRHAALDELAEALDTLRTGASAVIPTWSFHKHRRDGERIAPPADVIICEGIHAFHEPVIARLDIRVFVDAPATHRLDRWLRIEQDGERGWGAEETEDFFNNVADPTFGRYADDFRAMAHVLIRNA